jgi:hypothetical protein
VQLRESPVSQIISQFGFIQEIGFGVATAPVQVHRVFAGIVPDEPGERADAGTGANQDYRRLAGRRPEMWIGLDECLDAVARP